MQLTVMSLRTVPASFLASEGDHQDQAKKPTPSTRFIFWEIGSGTGAKEILSFLFSFNRMIYTFVHNGRYPDPAEATAHCRQ
jgi:hypothetical protein